MGYGTTWLIGDDGDFVIQDGEVVWVDGADEVGQSLKIIFLTQYTEDRLVPIYGFDVEALMSSDLLPIEQELYLDLLARDAVLQDDRVINIVETETNIGSDRVATVDMKLQLTNGELISLTLSEVL